MTPLTAALALGATMRLTRLVVADDIGQWWVKDPIDDAMARYHTRHATPQPGYGPVLDPEPWWWKYRSGLDCPFCVGYWIGAGVLASAALAGHTRTWRFLAATLALNEVAAHLGARLGDVPDEE